MAQFASGEEIYSLTGINERDLTYDNEALDVLTELFDDDNFSSSVLNSQQPRQQSPQTHHQDKLSPANVVLPDSPPYSGSEPYSPDSNKLLSPSCSDVSSHSGYHTGPSPDPPQHVQQDMIAHQLHNHLLQQQHIQQQHHLQHLQNLQQQLQHQNAAAAALAAQNGQLMGHPGMHMPQAPNNHIPQIVADDQLQSQQPFNVDANAAYPSKKRKFTEDSNSRDGSYIPPQGYPSAGQKPPSNLQIKQEPAQPCNFDCDLDPSNSMDISPSMLNTGSYQPIKWRDFEKASWCPTINAQGQRINVTTYRLDGDKGFNYSQVDKAFVCQKKNHFQITGCLAFSDAPQYVMTSEGPKHIESIYMHFYGAKEEAINQLIQVDQSQADRSKKRFSPVKLQPNTENSWKITIGRLHFSDTTLNNMRKRGKPNPDQRYFLLVVGIFAHCDGKEYPLVQQCSEKLIVRASNPGQFQDSEAEPVKWQPGQAPNTVYHSGKVGINTDTPDEALTVAGNVKVMGAIMQPSDRRVKEDISPVDTKEQLKNLQAINLYNYRYTEEFADVVGLDDPQSVETGVIAQELEVVIPEAVKTTSDVQLPNGEVVDNLKVVDKNRLFMESLGAVQELSNITNSLENKITYLERFNKKLQKLKRIGSIKSTASTDTDLSRVTSISTVSRVTVHKKHKEHEDSLPYDKKPDSAGQGVCSNRFLQVLIFLLLFVIVACVGVIVTMLLLEKFNTNKHVGHIQNNSGSLLTSAGGKNDTTTDQQTRPEPTTSGVTPAGTCGKNMLIKEGCSTTQFTSGCRVNTCTNQCKGFVRTGFSEADFAAIKKSTVDEAASSPFKVYLGSTPPQIAGSEITYSPFVPKENKALRKRKRRATRGILTGLENLQIGITGIATYGFTSENCLNCDRIASNYTYAVQVHRSFAMSTAKLTIEPKASNEWKSVLMCSVPEQPEDTLCTDPTRDVLDDDAFNVELSSKDLESNSAVFDVEIGRHFRTGFVLRFSKKPARELDVDAACREPLSDKMLELRLWFMRRCSDCGDPTRRIMQDLGLVN